MFLRCAGPVPAGRLDSSVEKNGPALNYSTGWGQAEPVDDDAKVLDRRIRTR
jgi:hypothetical protein